MSQFPEPPPVVESRPEAPPVLGVPSEPKVPEPPKNAWQKAWAAFLTFLAAFWKFAYPVFKLAKAGKVLLTAGSMLLSVWYYAQIFGWQFAAGFVICIFIHEMGHVFAAWRLGLPVSTPIFIPGMGAIILSKRVSESAWQGAIMGIGGPAFGALAAVGCWGIYGLTGNHLFLGLALLGFFVNLFNMIPMFPLDGGWITGAVSPYIWVIGLVGLVTLLLMGHISNPFIWLLIILSLPRIVTAFRSGTMDTPGLRTTTTQRVTMGIAYVALCAFLAWGVAKTHEGTASLRLARQHQPVQ